MLSDLVERGLDTAQGVLCVLDGAKALRKAVRSVLGESTPVQRCVRHKERNVAEHLPERDRPAVRRRLRRAWEQDDYLRAEEELRLLAAELERSHPGAAASLSEGLAEKLTVTRLGVRGQLRRTLASTNPCESMIECVRRTARNVKRWSSGEMGLRWTAAGMLEAERQFRRVVGYRGLAKLAVEVEREVAATAATHTRRRPLPPDRQIRAAAEVPRRSGHARRRSAALLLFDRLQRSNPAPAGHGEGLFAFPNRVLTGGTGYEQFLGGASRSTSLGP